MPSVLVTSVLANFLCDACTADDVLASANREITEHVESLNSYALANPGVRVAIAPPLPRSNPDWYLSYLPVFSTFLFHEVTRMGNPRLKYMAPFVAPPTFFEADGVHLNADAGTSFVHYLVASADLLFPPSEDVAQESAEAVAPLALSDLARDVSELRTEVRRRRCQDNLVFARIKEDRDFEINKSREDRCTISGLTVSSAPPQDPKERKEFFKTMISSLVTEALPEAANLSLVLDVIVNMRYSRGPPFFEVKFDSATSSAAFRVAAAKLAKSGTGSFKGVFVSNTVTLSTRIRIDILKLIAKRLTTTTEFSYVQGFSSRPILHYLARVIDPELRGPAPVPATGTGRSYTFAESVERWGDLLTRHSLESVRRKATQAFSGCLEQYFVVLSDRQPELDNDIFSRLLCPSSSTRSFQPRGYRRAAGRQSRGQYRGRGGPTGANVEPSLYSNVLSGARRDPAPKRGPSPDSVDEEPSKKEKTDD